jgi:phage terminase large subunit-like protein
MSTMPARSLHDSLLGELREDEQPEVILELRRNAARSLLFDWNGQARPKQLPPGHPRSEYPDRADWRFWVILAGRGFGKTRTGAEMVRRWAQEFRYVNAIAPTADDARQVLVEGESGLLAICPDGERPTYKSSLNRLEWPTGAETLIFSADVPDRLRGKQHEKLWADELAAWRYPEAWDQAMFGLRLGDNPQAVVTTTPRPVGHLKDLLKNRHAVVTRGTTYENRANLAPAFYDGVISKYAGTRLGRQELDAELLEDVLGALWQREMLDDGRVGERDVPDLVRIVVAVDPAVSTGAGAGETGIVVVGRGSDGHGYVLADRSAKASPGEWAARVAAAYDDHRADRVIGEANNGGDMVEYTLRGVYPHLSFRRVWASRGKLTRAEPVAALYEQGRVHHVGAFPQLEDQLCSWTPGDGFRGNFSPDRLDALVWGVSALMLGGPSRMETRANPFYG